MFSITVLGRGQSGGDHHHGQEQIAHRAVHTRTRTPLIGERQDFDKLYTKRPTNPPTARMWWAGWLFVSSLLLVFSLALVAENFSEQYAPWWGPFVPVYLLLACFCCFSLAPCGAYRSACTPDTSGSIEAARRDGKEDEVKRRIVGHRTLLRAAIGRVFFSSLLTSLLTATFVTLAVVLDETERADSLETSSWWWPASFLAAAAFVSVSAYLVSSVYDSYRRREANGDRVTSSFSDLLACCHPIYADLRTAEEQAEAGRRARDRAPACFGDYPVEGWATSCYNCSLPIIGILLGVVPLAWAGSLAANGGTETAWVALALLWTALALWAIASLILAFASFGRAPCYDISIVLMSIAFILLFAIASVVVAFADSSSPHVLLTPAYVALGVAAVFFCLLEVNHCKSDVSYTPIDEHDDHFEQSPDGSVPTTAETMPLLTVVEPVVASTSSSSTTTQEGIDRADDDAVADWSSLDEVMQR
jgi:hypothetical protein